MNTVFEIRNDTLKLMSDAPIRGGMNCTECIFKFSSDWNGFAVFAVFVPHQKNEPIKTKIVNNKCVLPNEVVNSNYFKMQIIGVNKGVVRPSSTILVEPKGRK